MCGFAGIFALDGLKSNQIIAVKQMTNEIKHRGPDNTNYFNDNFLSVGFNRLSIIDLKNGNQPMISNNRRFLVCMNGEIYNYKKLQKNLEKKNVTLRTTSDTEVFTEMFSIMGLDCLDELRGMYAILVYDFLKKKIYLIRDRMGIKPLHFSFKNNNLVFSSELSAICNSGLVNKDPNYDALSSYLSFRYNYGVGGYFKNIKSLKQASYLEFSMDGVNEKEYWKIPVFSRDQQLSKTSESKIIDKLSEIISDSISDHIVSDVPVASLLSGGLDSSLMSSIMRIKYKKNYYSFSAKFNETGYDETEYANIISEKIGTNHLTVNLGPEDYEKKISDYIDLKKTPLSIPHEIALFTLFKEIRKKTKVVLSGEGADEIFGGYGRVQSSAFDYKKKTLFSEIFKSKKLDISEFFLKRYFWMSFDEKKLLFNKEFYKTINLDEKIKYFWKTEFNKIKHIDPYDQFFYIFQKHHLTCLLDRLDYTSMSSGVEARTPFVDHKVIEFANMIPYELKFKWKSKLHKFLALFSNSFKNSENLDISKYILRRLSERYIPKKIAYRKKLGFPVPLDIWINNGMNNFAKSVLLDNKTKSRGLFNLTEIENILNHKEKPNYDFWGKKIWMMLNIELWFRKAIDK